MNQVCSGFAGHRHAGRWSSIENFMKERGSAGAKDTSVGHASLMNKNQNHAELAVLREFLRCIMWLLVFHDG